MISTEENRIIEWAKDYNPRFCFPSIDKYKDSYFSPCCDANIQTNLLFTSIPELQHIFDDIWDQSNPLHKISLQCAIAAFKNKPESFYNDDEQLYAVSDFIYIF